MDRGEQLPGDPYRLASPMYIDVSFAGLARARSHTLLVLEDPTPTGGIQAADAVLEGLLQHHDVVAEPVDHALNRCGSS